MQIDGELKEVALVDAKKSTAGSGGASRRSFACLAEKAAREKMEAQEPMTNRCAMRTEKGKVEPVSRVTIEKVDDGMEEVDDVSASEYEDEVPDTKNASIPAITVRPTSIGMDDECKAAPSSPIPQSPSDAASSSRPDTPTSYDDQGNGFESARASVPVDKALLAEEAPPLQADAKTASPPSPTVATTPSGVHELPADSRASSPQTEEGHNPVGGLLAVEPEAAELSAEHRRQPDGIPASSPPQSPMFPDRILTPPKPLHLTSANDDIDEAPQPPVSPPTHTEASVRISSGRDSMASVALSESSLDYDHLSPEAVGAALATPKVQASRHARKPSSLEILQNMWAMDSRPTIQRQDTFFDAAKDQPSPTPGETGENVWESESHLAAPSQLQPPDSVRKHGRRTSSLNAPFRPKSDSSGEDLMELDWQQLDDQEVMEREENEGEEDESTAFLLARLEQENAKIATASSEAASKTRRRAGSRPPSMSHLMRLVADRSAPSIRYSLALSPSDELPESLPEPPPMTELEFWAALVQDYPSTASRLPTLTTTKIRTGIPPPLRGVVWQSMSGARDRSLEEAFEKLKDESSPYEGIINKDVGRSFPGVELFRDAEGEGQRMLGRVLKCYSLHDKDVGSCQGLGFLVGPLLMNMGERDAFCVLTRLMDHYDLRPSFLPSLSGLHMRIYQFSQLLRQHHPVLSEHLNGMGIEPAYLSQWFLSCFAVTCPLPMLFRIYDVIFAEGANETVMRVALALMRRNEAKMMESKEFEEVMQLLLGRGIWDCYGVDADALVDDFTSLGNIITHARLAELEKEFTEKEGSGAVGASAGFLPDVQAAASRFLGRLWAPSHINNKSTSTLSPATAEGESAAKKRTASFLLRRSPSKQSIGTLNESSNSDGLSTNSSGSASTAPTDLDIDATGFARQSQATQSDAISFKSNKADSLRTVSLAGGHISKEERDMHGQIEDLLTALSEMQREQAGLMAMLQREREERGEDGLVLRKVVRRLQRGKGDAESIEEGLEDKAARRRTLPPPVRNLKAVGENGNKSRPRSVLIASKTRDLQDEDEDELVRTINMRLESGNARFSHSYETKAQLRSTITRTREQLAAAEQSCSELTARLESAEMSAAAFATESEDLRSEVNELRTRVNEEFKARQKLELTIRDLKAEASSIVRKERERVARRESLRLEPVDSNEDGAAPPRLARTGSLNGGPVGLRELRLGRRDSPSSIASLRMRSQRSPAPEVVLQTQQQPSASPTEEAMSPATAEPQTPFSATSVKPAAAPSLAPPAQPVWHARGSSLATKEVLSTPQHSVMAEDTLLLELVAAKTAEAQSAAEVEDLKRKLTLSTRSHEQNMATLRAQHEQMLAALQSQIAAANASANAATAAAEAARMEAQAARLETAALRSSGSLHLSGSGISVPTTPAAYDSDNKSIGGNSDLTTPVEKKEEKSPTSNGGGGWFWSRRMPSTGSVKVAVTPPPPTD